MAKCRAIPDGYMTVGEVAKKMGTTVRTLQYYDKEDYSLHQQKVRVGAGFIRIKI